MNELFYKDCVCVPYFFDRVSHASDYYAYNAIQQDNHEYTKWHLLSIRSKFTTMIDWYTFVGCNKVIPYVLDTSTEILTKVLCLFVKSSRSTPGQAQSLYRNMATIKTLHPLIRWVYVWTRDISTQCVLAQSEPWLTLMLSRRLEVDILLPTPFILLTMSILQSPTQPDFGSFLSVLMTISMYNTGVSNPYMLSAVSAQCQQRQLEGRLQHLRHSQQVTVLRHFNLFKHNDLFMYQQV